MRSDALAAVAVVAVVGAAGGARADGDPSAALGLSTSWLQRNDYGDRDRGVFVPEIVGFGYIGTGSERLHLRPGLRLGYVGLDRAQMPSAVRFDERDGTAYAEIGALYDGVVIPSVTVGAGLVVRHLELRLGESIAREDEPVSRWEVLPGFHAQVGAGIPLAGGALVVEPFVRLDAIAGDGRARWRYGVDVTVGVF